MKTQRTSGFIMLTVLIMAMILSSLGMTAAQLMISNARFGQYETRSASALNAAEAGVNYYLWHLSHNPTDYKDGGTTPSTAPYGPYVHNYYDNDGKLLGTYTLYVTPPSGGSTVTTVKAIGQVPHFSGTRTVLAQLGQPSFANYGLLSQAEVWFGSTETSSGPVMSNVGVRMDGVNNGTVSAGQKTYKPSTAGGGDGANHCGVWGSGGPVSQWVPRCNPPDTVDTLPAVTVDFAQVSANLVTLKTNAQSGGTYLAGSGSKGYSITLKANGKYDRCKVTNETFSGARATGIITSTCSSDIALPGNGVLFVDDNVWVSGTGFPGRITIVGASPGGVARDINITNNLTYSAKDGTAAVGLIASSDVIVSDYAPNTLEINAALLAQAGHVYSTGNALVKTGTLTFYGAIATFQYWTWGYVNGSGTPTSGWGTTSTGFDSNLIYAPPPQYPTTGNYSVLNWREQLYNP